MLAHLNVFTYLTILMAQIEVVSGKNVGSIVDVL